MLGLRLLGQEGCSVHCRRLSSIPGLNPCQKPSPLPSWNQQKHLQTLPKVPRRTNDPQLNYWPTRWSSKCIPCGLRPAQPHQTQRAGRLCSFTLHFLGPSLPGHRWLRLWVQTGGKKIVVSSDLDTLRLTQLNDSNITLWFGFNLEAICKAQPSICLMSGPRHICHTKTRPQNILSKKKVFSKANFQSVFENYIPPRWKTYIFILFRISTVNSWLSSFQGRPPLHLLALFLIFHLSFIYLTEFDRKFSER